MSQSSEVRAIARRLFSQGPCALGDIYSAVEESGVVEIPEGRSLVRAALYYMRQQGEIETVRPGLYQLRQEREEQRQEGEGVFTPEELERISQRLEETVAWLQTFNWIVCSDQELERARRTGLLLKKIGEQAKRLERAGRTGG